MSLSAHIDILCMSLSAHIDWILWKDILILGERPTQGLDGTTFTAEAKYPINFTQSGKDLQNNINSKQKTQK